MHYNLTKLNFLRLFRTKNIFPDFYKINITNPTLNSDPALTYSLTFNIFSRHANQPEFRFSKPNLKSSLIKQNKPDTSFLVDTNEIRSQQETYIWLTPPTTTPCSHCHLDNDKNKYYFSGLTRTAVKRTVLGSSKR